MVSDRLVFEYPLDKINPELQNDNISIEYELQTSIEDRPKAFIQRVQVPEYIQQQERERITDRDLSREDEESFILADELLSVDTCYRLYKKLEDTGYEITAEVNNIGQNHVSVVKYIELAEKVLWHMNYYLNEQFDADKPNNRVLENFITEHVKLWSTIKSNEIEGYNQLLQIDGMQRFFAELDEYPSIRTRNQAPYYTYVKMASLVDEEFRHKRFVVKILHTLELYGVNHRIRGSKLFTCIALNLGDLREYILSAKATFISMVQENINMCLAQGLSSGDTDIVRGAYDYINKTFNKGDSKRYTFNNGPNGRPPSGCFGLLLSNPGNFFSFSAFKDVADPQLLDPNIPGGCGKLLGLIASVEVALSKDNIKPEITNKDEQFYDEVNKCFCNLLSDLPLDTEEKRYRYRCCEKKLLSHVYKLFTTSDDVRIITTKETCSWCEPLLKQYKPLCNSLRAFYIRDYNTGTIDEHPL